MSKSNKRFALVIMALLLTGVAETVYGQSGIFDRTGMIPGHGAYSSLPEESVDLFTGNLTLSYRDIFLPGANGLNIEVWRVPEELSGSCLVRVSDADGTPTMPVIVSFEFNFKISAADGASQDGPHFVLRAGLSDLRTKTFQVAEVAFAPDGVRGSENLLFNHALGEVQELERFLGHWHHARITYDLGTYTGSVWVDNEPILSGVPLRTDLDVERRAEISLEPSQDVPVKLWVDDLDVRFVDRSSLGQDPEGVVFRPLFRDNFNRYESALFPREGGWLPSLEQVRGGEKRQGETAEEGAQVPQAARTEETAPRPSIDDQAYASSARSFKLEGSEKEPGTVTKRFSLPERVPYCVSAENFSIIEPAAGVRTERPGGIISDREKGTDEKRQKRGDRGTPDVGRGRAADRRQAERSASGVNSVRRATSKDQGGVKTLSGPPVSGTFYIYSFDGRLLAEYNLLGQLVRDYVYFGGQLVAEYRGGALYYYASDLINSTRIVTDYAGNVVYSAANEPYGGIQKTWVTDFDPELKFSGKPRDAESELDFFGPRYYDRSQFRLLSPNSVSAGSGLAPASHAWNAYSYPGNHPWAETYVVAGWMVSATNIEAVIPYRPLKPEPELPWWTVSYPWVTRAEDSLWVLIKSSGEKRGLLAIGIEPGWYSLRKRMDKADEAWKNWMKTAEPKDMQAFITAKEKEEDAMWLYVSKYEYGSDPVMDAYLANYGMSQDPDNPLSFWNPCYVMFHLFYSDI